MKQIVLWLAEAPITGGNTNVVVPPNDARTCEVYMCIRVWSVWIDPMLGGSGHVSDSLIAIVLGPVGAALLVAVVVFSVVKLYASRRRRQQRMEHGRLTDKVEVMAPTARRN